MSEEILRRGTFRAIRFGTSDLVDRGSRLGPAAPQRPKLTILSAFSLKAEFNQAGWWAGAVPIRPLESGLLECGPYDLSFDFEGVRDIEATDSTSHIVGYLLNALLNALFT